MLKKAWFVSRLVVAITALFLFHHVISDHLQHRFSRQWLTSSERLGATLVENHVGVPLTQMRGHLRKQQTITDQFRLTALIDSTHNGTNVWLTLKSSKAIKIELLNEEGKPLRSAIAKHNTVSSLGQILTSGIYTIRLHSLDEATPYTLNVTQTSLSTKLSYKSEPSAFLTYR